MSYGPQTRNPIEHDESPLDEDRIPCGCGDARCWLDPNDSTNVQVNGRWFTADCAGLCWNCGQVDDLRHLFPVGGGRLVHDGCPTPEMATDLELAAKADEARDDFEQRRR